LLAGVAHQADQGAGVDAGGEEGADGDVGFQVVADAIQESGVDGGVWRTWGDEG